MFSIEIFFFYLFKSKSADQPPGVQMMTPKKKEIRSITQSKLVWMMLRQAKVICINFYHHNLLFFYYAPPTIVEGHYVFWSVRLFVCSFVHPSVPLQVKVFGQGCFWWSWGPINLKLSTHVPYGMIFLILMPN